MIQIFIGIWGTDKIALIVGLFSCNPAYILQSTQYVSETPTPNEINAAELACYRYAWPAMPTVGHQALVTLSASSLAKWGPSPNTRP